MPSRYEFRLATKERGVRRLAMSGSAVVWDGRPAALTCIADEAMDEVKAKRRAQR